ncbi:4Fe-4S single cluster domain-containing protein [Streptosporangium sp. NPDC051022]|uniref:4Fe-4S single cluster domain-containing protein n=1 Tax=Streptosporangium sp. NPDC051022 TaxID=3155752 RepID=UPI00343200D3
MIDAGSRPLVNLAATAVGTTRLGPGRRSAAWVQGCPFRCRGCVAPEWIPRRPARHLSPEALAGELLADPDVMGFTFSGGEPMIQAAALAETMTIARRTRDLSLICFTGYTLERLRSRPPSPGVGALLAQVDVLIDGRYVDSRDRGVGLRGSDNQRVHHLTGRLEHVGYDFEHGPRGADVLLSGTTVQVVGIPPAGLLPALGLLTGRPGRHVSTISSDEGPQ